VDRYIDTCFLFIFVKKLGYFLNRFVVARICRSKDDKNACTLELITFSDHTDGVFIEIFTNFGDVKTVMRLLADRNNPCLDVKVAREFPI